MASTVRIRLKGIDVLQRKLNALGLRARSALRDAVNESALRIQRNARRACPVDTGRLKTSINIDFFRGGLAAEVGTDVFYAPFIEFGTGPLGEQTNTQGLPDGYTHGPRYFPPSGELAGWSKRVSGPPPFLAARAIFEKGGSEARPFLGPAFEDERPKFEKRVREKVKGVLG